MEGLGVGWEGGSPSAISTQPQGLIRGANRGELERDAVELAGGKGQMSQVSLDGRHRAPPAPPHNKRPRLGPPALMISAKAQLGALTQVCAEPRGQYIKALLSGRFRRVEPLHNRQTSCSWSRTGDVCSNGAALAS